MTMMALTDEEKFAGKYTLVVDDDPQFRELVKRVGKKLSLRLNVVDTADPMNALERCRMRSFDILITKEALPKMSGSFLVKRILEIKNQTPPQFVLVHHKDDSDKPDLPPINSLISRTGLPSEEELTEWMIEHLRKLTSAEERTIVQKSVRIDVNFINPFIDGTLQVLDVTCQTKAKRDKVFLRSDDTISGDISAVIGMTSPLFRGSIGIAFQRACFLGIVSNMLGAKQTDITGENQDAAGEICNQVFGIAKVKLNEQGLGIQPAIPSVVVGNNHRIKHLVSGPVIAVRFDTDFGHFTVEAALAG